jgi:secondary thiamine-phosphate synthase enzyme
VLAKNFSIEIPLHLSQEHESCESAATWEHSKLLRCSGKVQLTTASAFRDLMMGSEWTKIDCVSACSTGGMPRNCRAHTVPMVAREVCLFLDCIRSKVCISQSLLLLCFQHTSASLSVNENYDEDVRHDAETFLNAVVPEGKKAPWRHTIEGHDDMPAHIKSSMFGVSLNIPITDGHLNLGTWQGIWLCEHRDRASSRKIVVTMQGV